MTALDFPLNPSVGQTFGRWQWDGVKWISVGSGGGSAIGGYVSIQDIWPALPEGPWARPTGWYQNEELVFGKNGELPVSAFPTAPSLTLMPRTSIADNASVYVNLMGPMVNVGGAHWEQRFNLYVPSTTVSIYGFDWVVGGPGGGGGGGGAGSDGFTFKQDTVPTATTDGQTWFDTSTGNTFVWFQDADGGQWVQDGPGSGGDGGAASPLLSITSEKMENPSTFMDGFSDFTLNDPTGYPFPTVAEIEVSGIYMKPDRDVPVTAYLWSGNHGALDNPNNGATLAAAPEIASGGANWVALGELSASVPIPANTGATFVMRLRGVPGGATAFGYSFLVTRRRYRNGAA